MVPSAWSGVSPAPARPARALLVAVLPWFTYSLICAWCMAARSCQMVVAMEVPKEPAVMRTKFDKPEAAGIFSGEMPDSVMVTSGMKKKGHGHALDDGRDHDGLEVGLRC